jgi:hypothetical protein
VLCGITIALVSNWDNRVEHLRRSLQRKSVQLVVVMFVSNVVLLSVHHIAQNQIAVLADLRWWLGLFTFATPYSISGVLLPIAICIFVIPYLKQAGETIGWPLALFGSIFVTGLVQFQISQPRSVHNSLLTFGAGFPIVPMVLEGAIGFFGAMMWRSMVKQHEVISEVRVASVWVVLVLPFLSSPVLGRIVLSLLPLARVLWLIVVGLTISAIPILTNVTRFASLLGRFSLFCFIGHRIVIQSLMIFGHRLNLTAAALYATCFVWTLASLGICCHIRLHNPRINSFLKRCWL